MIREGNAGGEPCMCNTNYMQQNQNVHNSNWKPTAAWVEVLNDLEDQAGSLALALRFKVWGRATCQASSVLSVGFFQDEFKVILDSAEKNHK